MNKNRWEHFSHEADMGVRGIGNSKEEAFEQAAIAMSAVITDPAKISAVETVEIACAAPDDELLLVDWLNALIYEIATRKWLFSRFEVHIKNHVLTARAWGQPMDTGKHQLAVEIKGATYTALRVARESNGEWVAQCVVDV
ncbi:MAG: archease [Sulfuricaulis sp.]|uniref:archease n=1 Tax=Sulfuricaulis sp. TaxID=2003553 RepID=UPI003C518C3F